MNAVIWGGRVSSPSSVRAKITPQSAPFAPVIHILRPFSIHLPSRFTARVAILLRGSEPPVGSVIATKARIRPSTHGIP